MPQAYIVGAVRTAGGRRNGRLKDWHPADLGGLVIDALLDKTGADPAAVDDVIFGCVSQAGAQSSNIARSAALSSRLPESVPGTTVDRQCGSSQQSIHFAAQAVMSGTQDIVIAGGVEVMSMVPIGGAAIAGHKAGMGNPFGGKRMKARYPGKQFNQFLGAEMIAAQWDFSKDQLDEYALASHQRATRAIEEGRFEREIVPVNVVLEDGSEAVHNEDEGVRRDATLEGIAGVKLMTEDGRLTAATSSQICDGAAAVMIVNEDGLKKLGIDPTAQIKTLSLAGSDPVIMLTAPIPATQIALKKAGMKIEDIDLYEINEAFASVPMAWLKDTGADPEKLNVNGGAIALGHPLGGTGAKLMTTLVHELQRSGGKYGLQSMCEGGGMANATIIEML